MTTTRRSLFEGGTAEKAGYKLYIADPVLGGLPTFEVQMWGLWTDPELVPQFKKHVLLCMGILHGRGTWNVYGDLTGYPAQPGVISDLISSLMKEAMNKGFNRAGIYSDSVIAQLFITRLTSLVGMTTLRFFKTKEEARAYLRQPLVVR